MSDTIIKLENVSKVYRLGAIGGTTLREEVARWLDRLRGVSKPWDAEYGKEFLALDDISFQVERGERLGIIGHNGAGKSTLLKLLCRITAPSDGTISYNGRISSMLEVGTGFHGELTGRENIYMNGAILGMRRREIDAKIDDIISFSEMEQFIDTPVKRYSSGMYVKLAFAVAAHLDNEIMIMDEVLAVGDARFQRKCLSRMNEVSASDGRTILYVSHNMNTIRQLCTRCLVLDHGRLVFDGEVGKAIEKYLGEAAGECCRHIALDLDKRAKIGTRRVYFKSLDFLNPELTAIGREEPVELELDIVGREKRDDVRLRVIVCTSDGTPVGTVPGNQVFSLNEGENRIRVSLALAALPPGEYCLTLVLYSQTEIGTQERFDVARQTACFVKNYRGEALGNLEWNPGVWGYSVFPNAGIESIKRQ